MKTQRILQAHLKAAQANAESKLLKELQSRLKRILFLKNFGRFKKLKHPTYKSDKKALDK